MLPGVTGSFEEAKSWRHSSNDADTQNRRSSRSAGGKYRPGIDETWREVDYIGDRRSAQQCASIPLK